MANSPPRTKGIEQLNEYFASQSNNHDSQFPQVPLKFGGAIINPDTDKPLGESINTNKLKGVCFHVYNIIYF